MKLYEYNWMQVEEYLKSDDRVVIPLGSVEQHAYLSLGTDAIVGEACAIEAAEGTDVPVLPVMPFGLTPRFTEFAGTITLRESVFLDVVRDILDALFSHGFRRFLIVSGHAGNVPAKGAAAEWEALHPGAQVIYHAGVVEPEVWDFALSIDSDTGHASWVENFAATRVSDAVMPEAAKAPVDPEALRTFGPVELKELLEDGNFGGPYTRPQSEAEAVWQATVNSIRTALTDGWSTPSTRRCT
jgi:creatinine amidohydrolase